LTPTLRAASASKFFGAAAAALAPGRSDFICPCAAGIVNIRAVQNNAAHGRRHVLDGLVESLGSPAFKIGGACIIS
jgi:hypothetical protein